MGPDGPGVYGRRVPLLAADSSVLLVVDLQERLMPAIGGAAQVLENAARLVRANNRPGRGGKKLGGPEKEVKEL